MSDNPPPSLPDAFGAFLTGLEREIRQLRQEQDTLKQRLEGLEPASAPLTIGQLCARIPSLKIGTVREWALHRATNGLDRAGAILKRGRRLFFYEKEFLAWLRATNPENRRHVQRAAVNKTR
jgi:hypothetical protein